MGGGPVFCHHCQMAFYALFSGFSQNFAWDASSVACEYLTLFSLWYELWLNLIGSSYIIST